MEGGVEATFLREHDDGQTLNLNPCKKFASGTTKRSVYWFDIGGKCHFSKTNDRP